MNKAEENELKKLVLHGKQEIREKTQKNSYVINLIFKKCKNQTKLTLLLKKIIIIK